MLNPVGLGKCLNISVEANISKIEKKLWMEKLMMIGKCDWKKKSKSATTIKLRIKLSQTLLELQTHGKLKW